MDVELVFDPSLLPSPVRVAVVAAGRIAPPSTGAPAPSGLPALLRRVAAEGVAVWPEGRRERVRDMLRHGRFHPTGRSKPSSEFLLGAAVRGEFPLVNGPVDVNNQVSLETGFPASVFDADRTGPRLLLRRGRPGESYVFNRAGQAIDLVDLLVVCRGAEEDAEPCGNPVKDAMATKVDGETRRLVAVVYAPAADPPGDLDGAAARYAQLLAERCGAGDLTVHVVPP